jgi:hypothetical protein
LAVPAPLSAATANAPDVIAPRSSPPPRLFLVIALCLPIAGTSVRRGLMMDI